MRVFKLLAWILINAGIFALMLFVPARTLHWWRAWVSVAVVLAAVLAMAVGVLARSPGLLDERLKSPLQQGQPLADKIILLLWSPPGAA